MTVAELRGEINNLIKTVTPLAQEHPCQGKGTEFLRLLEGALRRNLMRLQAVNLLCAEEKLADSAFEITRNILEDTICVEYIFAKGAEEYSRRFYTFRWVQLKEDADFYRTVGNPLNNEEFPDNEEQIEKNFHQAVLNYPDFISQDKPIRSWALRNVDQMLQSKDLVKILGDKQIRVLAQTYLIGSRKTHLNPLEILTIMSQDTWDEGSARSQGLALLASSSSVARLTTRYVDEISRIENTPTSHDIARKVNEFLHKLNEIEYIGF